MVLDKGLVVIFGIGFVLCTIAFSVYCVSQRRLRNKILGEIYKKGPNDPASNRYAEYLNDFDASRNVVADVYTILSEETGLDFRRISLDEPFDGKLSKVIDGYDLYEAELRILEFFEIELSEDTNIKYTTTRELISLVRTLQKKKNPE